MVNTKQLGCKVALVTGCRKGIGLAIVTKFLQQGYLVYAGIRNLTEGSADLSFLKSEYPNLLHLIELDVTNAELCKNAFATIKKEQNRLDVLINNAGIVTYELVPFIQFDKFENMLQTNVIGLVRMCQLAVRFMARQNSGSIINISSIVAIKGASGQASYSATKGAVNAFTLSLAKEVASSNVRVNAIAPGMVATDRLVEISGQKFKDKVNQIGFGRMASPEEIANLCLFLASDDAGYLTGQIIGIDGGLHI